MAIEPFLVNPMRMRSRRRKRRNPFGETLAIIGANPRRGKRRKTVAVKRRKRVKHNAWPGHKRAHRAAAKRGWAKRKRRAAPLVTRRPYRSRARRRMITALGSKYANPPRRRYSRRRYMRNDPAPRRYHRRYHRNAPARRRYRNNPAVAIGGVWNFQRNLPFFFTGALSAVSVATTPALVAPWTGTTPAMKFAVQAGTVVGGAFVADYLVPRRGHGAIWLIVGGAVMLADVLKTWVLQPWLGLSDYEISDGAYEMQDALLPGQYDGVGAFPMSVGDDNSEPGGTLGAFPFEGGQEEYAAY